MVGSASFRHDRLKVFPVHIPPLRERKGNIAELVTYFSKRKAGEMGLFEAPVLAPGAIERLMLHQWPGNVRELENAVERAMIVQQGAPLDFSEILSFPPDGLPAGPRPEKSPTTNMDEVISGHIKSVLSAAGGKVEGTGGAAELLGINPGTLRHRMRKLGIPFGRQVKHHP